MPSRRSRLATATAFGLAAAIVAFGGTAPANAAPGDTAEAEGRFLTLTNVPQVIALDGAYTSYGPGDTAAQVENAPLDVDVLNGLANAQLAAGVTLGSLLDLDQAAGAGVLQQYASSGPAGATGAAGAVSDTGAIQVGQGAGQQTVIDLGSTIESIGAEGALSDLSLRFGAISSTTTSTGTGTPTSDYDIASAEAVLTSPLVAQISSRLTAAVNGIAPEIAADIDVSAATGPLLEGILGENVLTAALEVGTPTVTATANVNTAAVVQAALAEPLTNADGTVSIDVSAGSITVDLDRIQALNDRDPGASILTSAILADVVDSAITNIFTDVLPNRLVTALRASTTVDIAVTAPLTVGLLNTDAGDLVVNVDVSLDRLLGGTTGTAPTVSLDGTNLIGIPVSLAVLTPLFDDLVTGLLGSNADTDLLPAIGDALAGVSTGVITALAPALAVVDQVVRLTVNEQTPDAFIDGDGVDAGSSSVTALRVRLLGNGGPTIDLARSTVRAVPAPVADDVTITSPTPDQVIELADGQTTVVVPVTGTADPDAEVTLTVGGQTVGPVEVGPGGTYTLTPTALPAGNYTATVTQTIDGQAAGSATVTFTIAAAATDITITTPTADQVFLTTAADPTVDVPVEGAADVRASVTVTIPGQTAQTELVGADGLYDVAFADLPVGTYTATATQTIDGVVRGTATVTFTVGAPAAAVTITSPSTGDQILSAGTVPTADVPVTGAADPRATVTVTIPGQDPQTELVGDDGVYDVDIRRPPGRRLHGDGDPDDRRHRRRIGHGHLLRHRPGGRRGHRHPDRRAGLRRPGRRHRGARDRERQRRRPRIRAHRGHGPDARHAGGRGRRPLRGDVPRSLRRGVHRHGDADHRRRCCRFGHGRLHHLRGRRRPGRHPDARRRRLRAAARRRHHRLRPGDGHGRPRRHRHADGRRHDDGSGGGGRRRRLLAGDARSALRHLHGHRHADDRRRRRRHRHRDLHDRRAGGHRLAVRLPGLPAHRRGDHA
ncbi:choice-of-anchor G family protein [Clavibacter sepedonicus]|uniref:choice-of-anchor G family protein n=1 Tax=Clavibacter sepedonicus TaxID=31964 RepID=UPI003DA5204C